MRSGQRENAVLFDCRGCRLVGIHNPGTEDAQRGVLILVGGPQYRAGSHRQFTLLARALGAHGIPTFRFDYRGMGDSEGAFPGFDAVGDDLRAALQVFLERQPSLREICLWGLCDAASTAMMHACVHPAVTSLVLLNPWVREGDTADAGVQLKHWYLKRLFSRAFWLDLASGKVDLRGAIGGVLAGLRARFGSRGGEPATVEAAGPRARILRGMRSFRGRACIILSGDDLTAAEFEAWSGSEPGWRDIGGREGVEVARIHGADHTFSSAAWRGEVERLTLEWMQRD